MRGVFAALSAAVVLALFVGLNQAEARAVYHPYDKWLHASVFFLLWWLARASLPWHGAWVTLLVLALGGAEELRQAFAPGRTADWADMAANTVGAGVAALLYAAVRGLWGVCQGVAVLLAASLGTAVLMLIAVSLGHGGVIF